MYQLRRMAALALMFFAVSTSAAGPGAKAYNEFYDSDLIYVDERWQKYVDDIGQSLLKFTEKQNKRKFTFTILDIPVVNAFATADAYIFINRGLLVYLQSEGQLVAVIGHEIGHVIAGHHSRRRSTNLLGKTAGIAGWALTGRYELMVAVSDATRALVSGYGREMELEADAIGAKILARAGYNPYAVIEAVEVLKDQELFSKESMGQPASYHGLFSTHPKNDKRLHDAVAVSQSMLPTKVRGPVGDFWNLMDGLAYGDEATDGIVSGTSYYNSSLRIVIEFPDQWMVNRTQRHVYGEAPNGRDEAWISVVRHQNASNTKPEEFIEKVLKRSDIETSETTTIDGRYIHTAQLSSGTSDIQLSLLGLVYFGRDVYVLRGDVVDGEPEALRKWFASVILGIRSMTREDIEKIHTRRIKVIVAQPEDSYRSLAQRSNIRVHPEQTLRLINGGYPNGEPRAGDYVKIVQ